MAKDSGALGEEETESNSIRTNGIRHKYNVIDPIGFLFKSLSCHNPTTHR